jgi:hypothetical protein
MRARVARKVIKRELLVRRAWRGSTHRRALRHLVRGALRGTWSGHLTADMRRTWEGGIAAYPLMGNYILDLGGTVRPAKDLLAWGCWFEHIQHRRVALDELPDGTEVSTVFIGLDHRFPGMAKGPPILFETAFRPQGRHYEVTARAATRGLALREHARVVGSLLAGRYRRDDSGITLDPDGEVASA